MPVTTDGLVDEDVSGDGHYAGLTYVFDNVDATEDDFSMLYESNQHWLEYIEDVFEGSSERVTS
jgi:hypothetical protein